MHLCAGDRGSSKPGYLELFFPIVMQMWLNNLKKRVVIGAFNLTTIYYPSASMELLSIDC